MPAHLGPFTVLFSLFRAFSFVRALGLALSGRPYALGARIVSGILSDHTRAEQRNYRRRRKASRYR